MSSLIKNPSAWTPIAMSFVALSLVLGYVAFVGVAEPQEDEGTAAHLFQILMGGQAPIILFFMAKWIPQKPREALWILVLQIVSAMAAFAPVFILEL
ncbi:MAG TPA: hypothetical protein VJC11_03940 [Patescibacteria group bacterium]|nr:hypothetical protein [Patescibacteria group bacterium]